MNVQNTSYQHFYVHTFTNILFCIFCNIYANPPPTFCKHVIAIMTRHHIKLLVIHVAVVGNLFITAGRKIVVIFVAGCTHNSGKGIYR